jgi:hypothetical protein
MYRALMFRQDHESERARVTRGTYVKRAERCAKSPETTSRYYSRHKFIFLRDVIVSTFYQCLMEWANLLKFSVYYM